MNQNLTGVIGFLLILVGIALFFIPALRQNKDDMLPMLVGFATFIVGVITLFHAIHSLPKRKIDTNIADDKHVGEDGNDKLKPSKSTQGE